MSYAQRTLRSPHALTRAQQKTVKAALIGLAYLAGLVMIVMAQVTLDGMTAEVDAAPTAIDASAQ